MSTCWYAEIARDANCQSGYNTCSKSHCYPWLSIILSSSQVFPSRQDHNFPLKIARLSSDFGLIKVPVEDFDYPSLVCIHRVAYKVEMIFFFKFRVTMKSFSVIWCARNCQKFTLTGPTQGRLSYTYPDDSRWAVSGKWKQLICPFRTYFD